MRARSVLGGVMVAGVMAIGGAASASANIAWCLGDPPVQVQTPAGTNLNVNVVISVSADQARYVNSAWESATAAPDGNGGSVVTVYVWLPREIDTARVNAGVSKYRVTSSTVTVGGGDSTTFQLDVPTP